MGIASPMLNLTILGSTGSIGVNTLAVLALHPDRFRVFALTGHHQVQTMISQCVAWQPDYAVMADAQAAENVSSQLRQLGIGTQVLAGATELEWVAQHADVDCVMAGIVGSAGLLPTLAAVKAGKRVLLANKESLVMAGEILTHEAALSGSILLPVDSEHNAIFQCLPANYHLGRDRVGVRRIILTASGGAFRDIPLDQLASVAPEQAMTHPNWQMGSKITVDCATMVNKGLEVIEASWLFGLSGESIEVVLHPQSIIHSLVEYIDSSVLAQLGWPDMRTPIAHALAWPERMVSGVPYLDLVKASELTFQSVCSNRYPGLRLAYEALKVGGTAPTIFNAANEVAVQAFLSGKIVFTQIAALIEAVLEQSTISAANNLDRILQADQAARLAADLELNSLKIK